MLVLSRSVDEKIVFPNLGITVQVLKIRGQKARLGIDAPRDVTVLRHEIADSNPFANRVDPMSELGKGLRTRLNAAAVDLNALYHQLESDNTDDAEANIFRIFRELQSMDDEVASHCGDQVRILGGSTRLALLVDDNQNETQLLASYLRCRGFEVATAANGEAALNYLSKNRKPDFVLLDMQMPEFDGRWTIDKIRRTERLEDLKVFGVSGIHPQEYGVEVGERGLNQWFCKPLNLESLMFQMFNPSESVV